MKTFRKPIIFSKARLAFTLTPLLLVIMPLSSSTPSITHCSEQRETRIWVWVYCKSVTISIAPSYTWTKHRKSLVVTNLIRLNLFFLRFLFSKPKPWIYHSLLKPAGSLVLLQTWNVWPFYNSQCFKKWFMLKSQVESKSINIMMKEEKIETIVIIIVL